MKTYNELFAPSYVSRRPRRQEPTFTNRFLEWGKISITPATLPTPNDNLFKTSKLIQQIYHHEPKLCKTLTNT
jgi:hypothetical protein